MSQDYEADDYAASLVEKFQGPDLQTYVLTKDHDYFQLVSEYTRMWRVVTKDKLENLKRHMACLEKRLTRNSLLMYLNIHRKFSVLRKGYIRNRFLCSGDHWRSRRWNSRL